MVGRMSDTPIHDRPGETVSTSSVTVFGLGGEEPWEKIRSVIFNKPFSSTYWI